MLEKISISNKSCSFALSINQISQKSIIYFCFHKNITTNGTTIFNIDNNNKYFLSAKPAFKDF